LWNSLASAAAGGVRGRVPRAPLRGNCTPFRGKEGQKTGLFNHRASFAELASPTLLRQRLQRPWATQVTSYEGQGTPSTQSSTGQGGGGRGGRRQRGTGGRAGLGSPALQQEGASRCAPTTRRQDACAPRQAMRPYERHGVRGGPRTLTLVLSLRGRGAGPGPCYRLPLAMLPSTPLALRSGQAG